MNSDRQRYKLTLAYEGTHYVGWQIQPNGPSIQAVLEKALKKLSRTPSRPIGSGRTDAGVHATGQVAHVDLHWLHPPEALQRAINSLLPADIQVVRAEAAVDGFHARKSAREKWYRYVVCERALHEAPLLFSRHFAWEVSGRLNVAAMRRAAKYLAGRHNFAAFQGSRAAVKTTVRTLRQIKVNRMHPESPFDGGARSLLIMDFIGDGFLKQMVRNIVGTLVEVGQGRRPASNVRAILRSKDRKKAGRCAPPQGLTLMKVRYD